MLINASRHGSLVLIYQLYLVTLDSFYMDFGFAKLRFISCYASQRGAVVEWLEQLGYGAERGAVVEWLEQLGYGAESRRIA